MPLDESKFPPYLTIDVHTKCRATCPYCARQCVPGGMPAPQVMAWSLFERVMDEISRHLDEVRGVRFCNLGEPFDDAVVWPAISLAIRKEIPLYLSSNLASLKPGEIEAIASMGFRGRIEAHIQPGMGLDVEAQMRNYERALEIFGSARVHAVHVDPPRRWPLQPGNPTKRAIRCEVRRPETTLIVGVDGRCGLCCVDVIRSVTIGDVSRDGIVGTWRGPTRTSALQMIARGECDLCCSCDWGRE